MTNLKLNQFPNKIAEAETKILGLAHQVTIHKENLSFMDGEIELAIAFNKELKNEQQRKTKRLELKQEPDYLQAKASLTEATEKRDKAQIELNLIRNQFSVAKLEMRQKIANLEAVA
ncbi:MAG: hypothetical protein AB4372_16025 [Xenococcus sp. (in: cyanobacteria)]